MVTYFASLLATVNQLAEDILLRSIFGQPTELERNGTEVAIRSVVVVVIHVEVEDIGKRVDEDEERLVPNRVGPC
jgi:hypothetical protein